jgi:serine/threonine-protein kinase HipA
MIRLDVWLTLPSGESVKAGTLVTADADAVRGGIEGQFRYDPNYLNHPVAFSLDPLHLPLSSEIFNANRPHSGVHGVFEDSLPDDWGRRVMARRYGLNRSEQRVPNLLRLLKSNGLGALRYTEQGEVEPRSTEGSICQLQELERLANIFEQDPLSVADDELSLLFQAGSSPGGARPKALLMDDDGQYLAKFASVKDSLGVVNLEAAAMELARHAGIATADTRLVPLATGHCLLVKRFDITQAGGRNHLLSMQSLLKADNYYNASYRDLADVIRHVSAQPGQDLLKLYRQMVFNVLIGNTDDHLKNFLMLHAETGWHLSPAFDLVPNIGFNSEHVLRIGFDNRIPDGKALIAEAKPFGIKQRQQAEELIMSVYETVKDWETVFAKCQVSDSDIEIVGADVRKRLKKISLFS